LLTGLELLQAAVMITDMMKPTELSNLVIAYSWKALLGCAAEPSGLGDLKISES
jgi:hypothetical protein